MAGGGGVGGGGACQPPKGFSYFSPEWGELLFQTNFCCRHILGASVHEKDFQIGPTVLAVKLDKSEGAVNIDNF